MEIRCNLAVTLGLVLFATSVAKADWLELTAEGETQLQTIESRDAANHGNVPILQYHAAAGGSTHGFVRGMIIVTRDNVGALAFTGDKASDFNDKPDTFFKFRPYRWITMNAGGQISWVDYEFEWKWVASVRHEIDTLDDLCEMMSWRCMGANGADPTVDTTKAGCHWLLTQVDPNNQLDLNGSGGTATSNNVHEGYTSRLLLYGSMSGEERVARIKDCRAKVGPVGQYGAFDAQTHQPSYTKGNIHFCPTDSDFWDETPENVIQKLIEGMARCKKANQQGRVLYPIPYGRALLDSARTVAQFLCSDLAGVPAQDATQDGKGKRIRAFAFRARAQLLTILEGATPEGIAARTKRAAFLRKDQAGNTIETLLQAQLRVTPLDDEMPLDVFDLADAALDVTLMRDNSGLAKPYDDDSARLVRGLLRLAADSSRCAAPDPWPQADSWGSTARAEADSVARQSLLILMALIDARTQGNVPSAQANADALRERLVSQMSDSSRKPLADTASYVLELANGADPAETQREVQALFEIAIPCSTEPKCADAIATLKMLGGAGGTAGQYVTSQLNELKKRQQSGTGTSDEKKFLQVYGN